MSTSANESPTIATESNLLEACGLIVPAGKSSPAMSLDLSVAAGDLVLILSRDHRRNSDIVDRLLGLSEPPDAGVSIFARRWTELDREQAFLLRRAVGRVQYRGNWMETRSVMDNILLPTMHNTILAENELRNEASGLAQQFGLPGLPLQLPADCPTADLRRAACVRAFLGRPALVILEHPLDTEDSGLLSPMMDAIQQLRRRKGAVLWFTEHLNLAMDKSLPTNKRYHVVGGKLVPLRT